MFSPLLTSSTVFMTIRYAPLIAISLQCFANFANFFLSDFALSLMQLFCSLACNVFYAHVFTMCIYMIPEKITFSFYYENSEVILSKVIHEERFHEKMCNV
jgi:hypothetical protein